MIQKRYIIVGVALVAVQAMVLYFLGHSLICPCGYVSVWGSIKQGIEDSQQLLDWYSLSHVCYGIVIYTVLHFIGKKRGWSVGMMLLVTVALSVGWEIFENIYYVDLSSVQTASHGIYSGYYGDSIVNSVVDTLCVLLGFYVALQFPTTLVVILFILMEIIITITTHDNIILDIVTIFYPFAPLLKWQAQLT